MEDFERYSDYNEYEEDAPRGKSPLGLVLKILVCLVCVAVIGVLIFRMVLFDYYPDSMKKLYFNDTLAEYYTVTEGDIGAKTQEMRAPYDDPDKGRFFCDNLIIIPEINQLQVSVRFNVSLMETLKADFLGKGIELDLDENSTENFTFRLVRNPVDENSEPTVIGELSYMSYDSLLMYRYCKLVFDGVELGLDVGEDEVNWIRLEVFVNGVEMDKPYMIAIYENNDVYSTLDEYNLSSDDRPVND